MSDVNFLWAQNIEQELTEIRSSNEVEVLNNSPYVLEFATMATVFGESIVGLLL